MIRSCMDARLSNLPVGETNDTDLSDIPRCSIFPDEMQQVVFAVVQDDRTLLRLGVNEISAIASKCATGFESQDESLCVGVVHRTESG